MTLIPPGNYADGVSFHDQKNHQEGGIAAYLSLYSKGLITLVTCLPLSKLETARINDQEKCNILSLEVNEKMNNYRKNAIVTGVLYIIGTVAGILSLVFINPLLNSPDLLTAVSADGSQLILGALLILVMALALAMVPVVMFPVLRRHNEVLALGYVVFRGALETFFYFAMVISSLFLLILSQVAVTDSSALQTVATELLELEMLGSLLTIVFILGALMFYTVLYQSKLVPRWLSGWGLIAALLYLAAGFLVLFGTIEPMSTTDSLLQMPLGIQEMALALWLIVKGFNSSAMVADPAA